MAGWVGERIWRRPLQRSVSPGPNGRAIRTTLGAAASTRGLPAGTVPPHRPELQPVPGPQSAPVGFRARDLCSDTGDRGAGGEAAQSGRATHADIHIHTFRHLVWLSLSTHKHRTPFTDARPVDYSRCLYENTHRRHARSITFYRWPTTVLQNESRSGLRGLLGWEPMVRNRFRTSPTLSDPDHPPVCEGLCFTPSHSARGFLVARLAGISPPLSLVARFPRLVALLHSSLASLVARRSSFGFLAASLSRYEGARSSPYSLLVFCFSRCSSLALTVPHRSVARLGRLRRRSSVVSLSLGPRLACLVRRPSLLAHRSSLVARRWSRCFFGPGCSHLLVSRPGLASDSRLSVETISLRRPNLSDFHQSKEPHSIVGNPPFKEEICNRCPKLAVYGRKFSCVFSLLFSSPPQNFEWRISDDTVLPIVLFSYYVFRAVA